MKIDRTAATFALIYILVCGIIFAQEAYTRIYDRGNSEMAGLATYLFTMPSSLLVDRISTEAGIPAIGGSDGSFFAVLGICLVLNACLIYFATATAKRLISTGTPEGG